MKLEGKKKIILRKKKDKGALFLLELLNSTMGLGSRGKREIRRLSEQEERVAMRTTASGGSWSTIWFRSIIRRRKSTITSDS